MKTKSANYRIALSLLKEQTSIQNATLIELQRHMLKIQQLALRFGRRFDLKSKELRGLHTTLVKMQVASHLAGKKRARQDVKGLKLDTLDSIINRLEVVNQDELDRLYSFYDVKTINILNEMTTKINTSVRRALAESTAEQLQTKSATEIFASALARAGVSPANSYYAENIVRTHTQLAYNAARWQEYQDPTIEQILWGYTYVTVGDDRVREEHVKIDGVTLPKDDPFWQKFFPPNGWSCRCQAIPVFEPQRIKRAPADAKPDAGFEFNAGTLLRQL